MRNTETFVRVEYDTAYNGGDYYDVGHFAYIPLSLVEAYAKQNTAGENGVELAFTKHTNLDCRHIVDYNPDKRYNANHELVQG